MRLLIAGFICIFIAASLLYYLYYRKNKLYLTIVKQNQDAIRREQQLQNKIDEQFAEIGRQSALLQEYLTDSTKTSLPQPEKYASSSLTDEKKQDLFIQLFISPFTFLLWSEVLLPIRHETTKEQFSRESC